MQILTWTILIHHKHVGLFQFGGHNICCQHVWAFSGKFCLNFYRFCLNLEVALVKFWGTQCTPYPAHTLYTIFLAQILLQCSAQNKLNMVVEACLSRTHVQYVCIFTYSISKYINDCDNQGVVSNATCILIHGKQNICPFIQISVIAIQDQSIFLLISIACFFSF